MWRLEYAVTLLPYTKIAPMMQCAMGAIYTVMHVYCTYFYYSHSKVDSLLSTFYLILRRLKCLIDSLCFYRSEAAKRQFVVGEETVDLCLDFVRISLVIPVKIGISTMGAFCIAIRIVSILPRSRIFAAT